MIQKCVWIRFIFAGIALWIAGGCLAAGAAPIRVVTTFYPVYDFVRQVGGEDVEVTMLLPPGVEPHHYSPSPSDVLKVRRAEVFVYLSDAMETWLDGYLEGIKAPELTVLELLEEDGAHGPAQGDECDGPHDHHPGDKDPHVWLDPIQVMPLIDKLAGVFSAIQPDKAGAFHERAAAHQVTLAALDEQIRQTLSDCDTRTIVYGGHFAFYHFASRYHLDYWSAYPGISPDSQPSPRSIAALIQRIKQENIRTIFYEDKTDPKLSRVLAEESGAILLPLYSIHKVTRKELDDGVDYLRFMEMNVDSLKKGLGCRP